MCRTKNFVGSAGGQPTINLPLTMHHELDAFKHEVIVSGMWSLGSKFLIKDFANNGYSPGNDFIMQKFLHDQPDLKTPLVDRIELLSQPTDKTYLLLMSRAEG
jgi:hypothetical protein